VKLDPAEVEFSAIRAQGPGGQNVNKVSCAVHARFDVKASSLPDWIKERLLAMRDNRITEDGVIVLKAQQSRSLEANKEDALRRLQELVDKAAVVQAVRRPTKPTRGSQRRRLDEKTRSGQVKALRGQSNFSRNCLKMCSDPDFFTSRGVDFRLAIAHLLAAVEDDPPAPRRLQAPDRVESAYAAASGVVDRTATIGQGAGIDHLHLFRLPRKRRLRAVVELAPFLCHGFAPTQHLARAGEEHGFVGQEGCESCVVARLHGRGKGALMVGDLLFQLGVRGPGRAGDRQHEHTDAQNPNRQQTHASSG
jgi:ribosome-associated protein